MRLWTRFAAIASWFLVSALGWGQLYAVPADRDRDLLARLSFASTWAVDNASKASPQICFSVDLAGHYRMRRLTTKGGADFLQGSPHPEVVRGTLQPKELRKLGRLLGDPDFRNLDGSFGGLVRKGAETFVAEVPRESGVQRIVVSDPDRENRFPDSVSRIVSWLQDFEAVGAEAVDVSSQDICPSGALQPINPATALVKPIP